MSTTVVIASYGEESWSELAHERALPSVRDQECEVLIGHDPHGSIASVRNELAAKATGDWLCFLDADDELGAGFVAQIERIAHRQARRQSVVLLTPAISYVNNKTGRRSPPKFWPECELATGNWLVIGTVVPTALFREIGGFHDFPHGLEDWNLWARCVRAGASIIKVPRAIYIAYQNHDSKHHQLLRNRRSYLKFYEAARKDAWG